LHLGTRNKSLQNLIGAIAMIDDCFAIGQNRLMQAMPKCSD